MANNDINSMQEFLDNWDGNGNPPIILRENMNVEEMNQYLFDMNGVAETQPFEFTWLHQQDLNAIFMRECIQQSKDQSNNGAYYHSSMPIVQFLERASEATGELLSIDFMQQALGKQFNEVIEQYFTASKRPSVRLYKGKKVTMLAEQNFYQFAEKNFGWRSARPAELILRANWNGAGDAYPRNDYDEREFAKYHNAWGADQSQAGTSAQGSRQQAEQQPNAPVTQAKAKPPAPTPAQWNNRNAPWRQQNQRNQGRNLQ